MAGGKALRPRIFTYNALCPPGWENHKIKLEPTVDSADAVDRPELQVPELRAEAAGPAELRPRRVAEWLANLPYSDPLEAAPRLHQALYTLNRVPLVPANRWELLGLYAEPVGALGDALQSIFASLPLPLSGRAREAARWQRALKGEMAVGYKRLLYDATGEGAGAEWTARAAGYAIHRLGAWLCAHYQVYLPAPSGLWRELHRIYAYAETLVLDLQSIPDPESGRGPTSVNALYQRVLLLGACNPYGLALGDAAKVERLLSNRPVAARVAPAREEGAPEGRFLVNLRTDLPPLPWPRDDLPEARDHLRMLDASAVAADLRGLAGQLEEGTVPPALKRITEYLGSGYLDLLHRVRRAWGVEVRRRSSRVQRREPVSVCVGLNAAHYMLNGQRPFVPPQLDAPPGGSTYLDLDDWMGTDLRPGDLFSTETWRNVGAYQVFRWHTRDEGAGGMCLAAEGEVQARLRVGDLLLLRLGDDEHWRAGAVRWLKCTLEGDRLELGVQLLGPRARPVAVRSRPPAGGTAAFHPGLLLPAGQGAGQTPQLAIPRGVYQPGRPLQMVEGGDAAVELEVLEVLERTGAFERLAFDAARSSSPDPRDGSPAGG